MERKSVDERRSAEQVSRMYGVILEELSQRYPTSRMVADTDGIVVTLESLQVDKRGTLARTFNRFKVSITEV